MKLKEIRESKGYSQREFALQLGLLPQSVSRYENGQIEPNLSTLIKMADFLHVTVDELVGRPTNLINKMLLSDRERSIIEKVLSLNPKLQELTEFYIDTLMNSI